MIRIICPKCKNAYLKKEDGNLICPSCEAVFPESRENLLSGAQYYNEGDYSQANDYLMKYIVKNGADPEAIFYKALCDAYTFDEDTSSLKDLYTKLFEAVSDLSDDLFPVYLALANDDCEKVEKLITENHIKQFETADAEKIKKEVSIIINLQNEAKEFRNQLTQLVAEYNQRATTKISVKLSSCCLVEPSIASEVGSLKFDRVKESIEAHTVFTGILSTDIKNLEIYYRCIVMFFEKNRQKYDFLMESAEKFIELSSLLEEGRYSSIKGVSTIAGKLKSAAYDFFQESLKDHDDEFEQQTETVVFIAPETVEIPVEEAREESADEPENTTDTTEEAQIEYEDVYSSSEDESTVEPEEAVAEADESESVNSEAVDVSDETVLEIVSDENTNEEEQVDEIFELPVEESDSTIEETIENTEDIVSQTEELTTPENSDEATAQTVEEAPVEEDTEETVIEIPDIDEISETSSVTTLEKIAEQGEVEETENTDYEKVTPTKESSLVVKHKKSYGPFIAIFLVIFAIIGLVALKVVPGKLNEANYEKATNLLNEKNYSSAAEVFAELEDYSDAKEKTLECLYKNACELESQKKYEEAKVIFAELGNYEDSAAKKESCSYKDALIKLDNGKYDEAAESFKALGDYADSKNMVKECSYKKAVSLINNKEYEKAIEILKGLGNYSETKTKILDAKYGYVTSNLDAKNKTTASYLKDLIKANYKDSSDLSNKLLGTTEEANADSGVVSCINYNPKNTKNNLKEVDNSKAIYFHVTVNQADLYNKTLTIDYATSMGYHETKDIVLTESDNTYAFEYPSTPSSDYTVTFKLISPDNVILTQKDVLIK